MPRLQGRETLPRSKAITRNKIRGNRSAVKQALRNGTEPAKTISAGRTD